jgi:hypothetical protein
MWMRRTRREIAVLSAGTVSTDAFLRKIHSFAVDIYAKIQPQLQQLLSTKQLVYLATSSGERGRQPSCCLRALPPARRAVFG